jgi:hypothetical protein
MTQLGTTLVSINWHGTDEDSTEYPLLSTKLLDYKAWCSEHDTSERNP